MPEIEPLDLVNVIEIQKIREILIDHPDLLSMFELLCIACNKRLNQDEQPVLSMELEPNPLLNLSDHSSDED